MTPKRARMVVLLLLAMTPWTGGIIRGPGKYHGVVVVDRWDGCAICYGSTVNYIAEKLKPKLRHLAGQPVELDARKVRQPVNPGEARIDEAVHLGPAKPRPDVPSSEGLTLSSRLDLRDGEGPAVVMTLTNSGDRDREVSSAWWNFVVFAKKGSGSHHALDPADGPSFAVITGQTFVIGPDNERRWRYAGVQNRVRYAWDIGEANALPVRFVLRPGQARAVRVAFELPQGEYDLFPSYTAALPGNPVAFDVDARGRATAAKVPGRDPA